MSIIDMVNGAVLGGFLTKQLNDDGQLHSNKVQEDTPEDTPEDIARKFYLYLKERFEPAEVKCYPDFMDKIPRKSTYKKFMELCDCGLEYDVQDEPNQEKFIKYSMHVIKKGSLSQILCICAENVYASDYDGVYSWILSMIDKSLQFFAPFEVIKDYSLQDKIKAFKFLSLAVNKFSIHCSFKIDFQKLFEEIDDCRIYSLELARNILRRCEIKSDDCNK